MFTYNNEVYSFQFKHKQGMNFVLENSPWMVSGRPLIVQKWSPGVCLDKHEPEKSNPKSPTPSPKNSIKSAQ